MSFIEYDPRVEEDDLPEHERRGERPQCNDHSPHTEHFYRGYWMCTLSKGHTGDHIAHDGSDRMIARWNSEPPQPKTTWDSDYGTTRSAS